MQQRTTDQQFITSLRQLDQMVLRQRRTRLSIRAAWLAGLVFCMGVIARTWLAVAISPLVLALLTLVTLALGLVYAWKPPLGLVTLSRSVDATFELDAELATALELAARRDTTGFATPLTERARRHLALLIPEIEARAAEPLRLELQTFALVLILGVGIVLLGNIGGGLPNAPAEPLPSLAQNNTVQPPDQPGAEPQPNIPQDSPPTGSERPARRGPGEGPPQLDPAGEQAAQALSDALRDNGATRAVADALDRGDTDRAADELRDLADRADQLSAEARNDIANSLERAADRLQGDQPDLAEQLRRNAQQMRGSADDAAQALEDLARTVENLGQQSQPDAAQGQPDSATSGESGSGEQPGDQGQASGEQGDQQGQGGGASDQAGSQSRTSPPAGAPQQEVPLPPPDDSAQQGPTVPGAGNSDTTVTLPGGTGSGGQGAGGQGGSVPPDLTDPAAIPPELRDAIKDYFEPAN